MSAISFGRRSWRQAAQQLQSGLLESLGRVSCVVKRLFEGLGLSDQFWVKRRRYDVTTFLRRFKVQDQFAVAHRVTCRHEQLRVRQKREMAKNDVGRSYGLGSLALPAASAFLDFSGFSIFVSCGAPSGDEVLRTPIT